MSFYYSGWIILLWFSYSLILAFYRIYLHPLARFPGPKLTAATGWYETYADLFQGSGGGFMDKVARMHSIYGPIVRVNPHEVHVCDSNWLDTLYTSPTRGKRDKYPPAALLTGTPEGIFGTVPHDLHKLRRDAVAPLLSRPNVAAAVPMVYEHTDKLLARIGAQVTCDGYAEMQVNCLALATETAALYSTGRPRGLLDSEALAAQWRKSLTNLTAWTSIGRHFSWAILLVLLMPTVVLRRVLPDVLPMVGLHRDMLNFASSCARNDSKSPHTKSGSDTSSNVFSTILSNDSLPPSEKAIHRIAQEGVVLVAAGSDTTARAMTTAIYFVLKDKNGIQARLEQELQREIPDPSSRPALTQLQSLPCLTAVIKESLRLMSLPTIRFPLISPHEPLRYKQWVIPAGTPVSMTLREVLQDPEIFQEPLEFRPERWLASGHAGHPGLNRYFVPFGRGNRMCMGMSLAYTELYVVLASLFRGFNLGLHDSIRNCEMDVVRGVLVGDTTHNIVGLRVTCEPKL